jgi:hypothetical protein
MCDPWRSRWSDPLVCLVLVSSLNFRKERRTKQARAGPGVDSGWGTHVYPSSNPTDQNRTDQGRVSSGPLLDHMVYVQDCIDYMTCILANKC